MNKEARYQFIKFVSESLNVVSNEALRVGCFLFSVLIKKPEAKIVLLDELQYGWCIEKNSFIKTIIAPTGLSQYEIEKGIVELVKLGIFNIHIDRKLKQITMELNDD